MAAPKTVAGAKAFTVDRIHLGPCGDQFLHHHGNVALVHCTMQRRATSALWIWGADLVYIDRKQMEAVQDKRGNPYQSFISY